MKKDAFKEAVTDTLVAIVINFPLNMILLAVSQQYNMTVFWASVFFTVIFTIVAIVRKTYMRMFFEKRNQRKIQEKH